MSMLAEQRLSMTELAQRENVNASTTWRWAIRGVKGVRLETFHIGGKRYTTVEAFNRFVERTTAAAQGQLPAPAPRTNRQREAAINRAEKLCEQQGI